MKVSLLQATVALAILLLLSVAGNIWQFSNARVAAAVAPLEQKLQTAALTAQISGKMEALRIQDGVELESLRKLWAERPVRVEKVYLDRTQKLPVPTCAPGKDRVDAWNSISTESTK